MKIEVIANGSSDTTLTVNDFTIRHYPVAFATSVYVGQCTGFTGKILEVHVCPEVMDTDVVDNLILRLMEEYAEKNRDTILVSDTPDNGNEGIYEIDVVKPLVYTTRDGEKVTTTGEKILIYKKHRKDRYTNAIAKELHDSEYGEGSYGSH